MATATDLVLTSTQAGVTTVTMNRPEALNALSAGLRNRLTEVFINLAEDSATEVIVFTGNGRAFTVGLDLKELGGETAAATVVNKDLGKAMLQVNKPIIGAINGYVVAQWRFRGANLIFALMLFGCFIPFQVVLLPMARLLGMMGLPARSAV